MVMKSSLLKNIHEELKKLMEQAPPPPPDAPPPDAGAPPPDAPADAPPDAPGGESGEEEKKIPEGQPPINRQDPTTAVVDYAKELAGKTIDVETILKGVKTSIQYNFGNNYQLALGVIDKLKQTENLLLYDVAERLRLLISGTIKENNNKGKRMRVSKEDIRNLVKETLKERSLKKRQKNVSLTKEQFERVVESAVKTLLNENTLFDQRRSMINQERSTIESQLLTTEIREMAIDLFEKICQKAGLDAESLTPEAMQFVEAELDVMLTSAQELSNKLIQVAAVVNKAREGSSSSKSEGQG